MRAPPKVESDEYAASKACDDDFAVLTKFEYLYFPDAIVEQFSETAETTSLKDKIIFGKFEAETTKLLELHTKRLRDATTALGWDHLAHIDELPGSLTEAAIALNTVVATSIQEQFPDQNTMHGFIVRLSLPKSGSLGIGIERHRIDLAGSRTHILQRWLCMHTICPWGFKLPGLRPSMPCKVQIASKPIRPTIHTRHKTTYREHYNEARSRAPYRLSPEDLPTVHEVLVFNHADQIMEATCSSVYFCRRGKWVTPSAACGGVNSVTKMYALEKGWCKEGIVSRKSVKDGEHIWMSNAARWFFPGVVYERQQGP